MIAPAVPPLAGALRWSRRPRYRRSPSTFSYCAWTASTAVAVALWSAPAAAVFSRSLFAHSAVDLRPHLGLPGGEPLREGSGREGLAGRGHVARGGRDGRPGLGREVVVVDAVERHVERVELLHGGARHAHQALVARVQRFDRLEEPRLRPGGRRRFVACERVLQADDPLVPGRLLLAQDPGQAGLGHLRDARAGLRQQVLHHLDSPSSATPRATAARRPRADR